ERGTPGGNAGSGRQRSLLRMYGSIKRDDPCRNPGSRAPHPMLRHRTRCLSALATSKVTPTQYPFHSTTCRQSRMQLRISTSCFHTLSFNVGVARPILGAKDLLAAGMEEYSSRCSGHYVYRNSRIAGENLPDFFMAPFSLILKPPQTENNSYWSIGIVI